jgi:hypothetical protein
MHTKESMITFMIPPAKKRALKIVAAENDMTISEYLRNMIDGHPAISERVRTIERKISKNGKA